MSSWELGHSVWGFDVPLKTQKPEPYNFKDSLVIFLFAHVSSWPWCVFYSVLLCVQVMMIVGKLVEERIYSLLTAMKFVLNLSFVAILSTQESLNLSKCCIWLLIQWHILFITTYIYFHCKKNSDQIYLGISSDFRLFYSTHNRMIDLWCYNQCSWSGNTMLILYICSIISKRLKMASWNMRSLMRLINTKNY